MELPPLTGVDKEVYDEYAALNEKQIFERIKDLVQYLTGI